jgi:hypothetical protein
MSLTECNSDTTQNCPFYVSTAFELNTVKTTKHKKNKILFKAVLSKQFQNVTMEY